MSATTDLNDLAPTCTVSSATYEGAPCLAVSLGGSTPRADLISLHAALMRRGHTCIDRTNEPAPSILVLSEASR